jgi:hypothetical protein
MPEILDLVDRASRDPEFLRRLRRDPALRELLRMDGASDTEVAEALQARLSYSWKNGVPDECAQHPDLSECTLPDAGRRG